MTPFPILDWHINTNVKDARDHLGRIPLIFNPDCPDPAWQQIKDNYPDGFEPEGSDKGWVLTADDALIYPGLPALEPSAFAMLRDQRILVYAAGWVVIAELEGAFTVVRIEP